MDTLNTHTLYKITINEAELSKDIFNQDKLYNTMTLLARKIFSLL